MMNMVKNTIFYKSIQEARLLYKTRVSMLPFAGNYPNDARFAKTNWLCLCGVKEDERHLTSGTCKVFGDLVDPESDFSKDDDLVDLFSNILKRRDDIYSAK